MISFTTSLILLIKKNNFFKTGKIPKIEISLISNSEIKLFDCIFSPPTPLNIGELSFFCNALISLSPNISPDGSPATI